MTSAAPFHTSCAISGLAVCNCPHGSRDRSQISPADQQKQAAATWDLWQSQAQLFPKAGPVDVQLPRLRREITVPETAPLPAGLPSLEDAQKKLQACCETAKQAVVYAAKYAAAAGLPYNPGIDIGIDLQQIRGPDPAQIYALEARAQAVRRAITERQAAAQAAASHLASLPVPSTQPSQVLQAGAPSAYAAQRQGSGMQHSSPYEQASARARQPQWQDSPRAGQQSVQGSRLAPPMQSAPEQKRKGSDSPSVRQPSHAEQPLPRMHQQGRSGLQAGAHASGASETSRQPAPKRAKPNPASSTSRKPDGKRRLNSGDVRSLVAGQWLQLFWPDDGTWWPAQLIKLDLRSGMCHLLYENGEEETDCNLVELVGKNEVAWWDGAVHAPASSAAVPNGRLDDARRPSSASLAGDPTSVVGSHVPTHKVEKRARSTGRARPSAKQKGLSGSAGNQPKARSQTQYKSDSDNDISSLSEDDDFAAYQRGRAARTQARGQTISRGAPQPPLPAESKGALARIMAMGPAAIGRQVVVTAAPPSNRQFNATITKAAAAGGDFVVVRYEGGTETELHREEEGHMFSVQLN